MIESTKIMFNKWKDFKGKSDRREFWLGYLGVFLITIVLTIIPSILLGIAIGCEDSVVLWLLTGVVSLAWFAAFIYITVALLAATVRRLLDAGFPWWVIFVNFVPSIGQIALIVFLCLPSSETPIVNFVGNDAPKAEPAPASAPATPAAPIVVDVEPEEAPVVEEAPASTSWTCPGCGAESEGKFCGSCGAAKPE